jgi:translation initiation factor 2B subunit (eIF-2B alpha/beta/delta family)
VSFDENFVKKVIETSKKKIKDDKEESLREELSYSEEKIIETEERSNSVDNGTSRFLNFLDSSLISAPEEGGSMQKTKAKKHK